MPTFLTDVVLTVVFNVSFFQTYGSFKKILMLNIFLLKGIVLVARSPRSKTAIDVAGVLAFSSKS